MNGFTIVQGLVFGAPATGAVAKGCGDFNGDGTYDIVWQHPSTKTVFLMSGENVALTGQHTPMPANVWELMAAR